MSSRIRKKALQCCEPLSKHLFPGRFLTGCRTSGLTHVTIGKLNSLVPTSSVSSMLNKIWRGPLFMLVRIWRERTLVSPSFVAHAVFMDEVQDKVKQSGLYWNFISEHDARESREWSPIFPRPFPTRPSANSGEDVSREINFSSSSYTFALVCLSRTYAICLRVSAHLGTRSDDDDDDDEEDQPIDRPTWWITHAFAPNDSYGCKRAWR